MRLFGTNNSYTNLPDERDALRWPHAAVACLEKLRRRTRWMSRRWSWRTVVLNAAGHLIVYRSQHTGRVYALPTARRITVSVKPQFVLLHVVDEAGKRVTLRGRGPYAAQWAALLFRYTAYTNVEERSQRQNDAAVQPSVDQISVADKSFVPTTVESVSRLSSTVQRNASANEASWPSLPSSNRDESVIEIQEPSTLGQLTTDSRTITVFAEVHPQSGCRVLAASRSSSSFSSDETGETVVLMRSQSLSAVEMMQQQEETAVEWTMPLRPVRTLSADDGGQRTSFVRQLSAILQRQIDSQNCSSTTSAPSFSEFKTRGTVQMYRPPPSPPPNDLHRQWGPSPMLSADFLQLRAASRS
uniref:PH-15 domain-containing protein n=1 Tax=Plectus sambesii TaxID=2011161 RepID=A0A914XNA6_9BILA